MTSLKTKTISGLFWSFIDNFSRYGLTFIIGIILARLLSPSDFGIIGMLSIFFAVSTTFIDSGFSMALIRKQNTTDTDLSSVFYFNIILGVLFYMILFLSAGLISDFFNEPKLVLFVRILGIGVIIGSFSSIQQTILTKEINFKLQTKISIISTLVSGIVGISLAYGGYGVWSLVIKSLIGQFVISLLLWTWNKWKPKLVFSVKKLKEMFSFGYKLMLSGLLNTIFQNIYYLIIGKYFSATDLGYYTRADQFNKLPSQNITSVIQRVSYPVLSEIQNDNLRLAIVYKKIIKSTMLISFVSMFMMISVAKPLILTLLGEKWLPSVTYLQLLGFVGMLYPLNAINLNMLNVQGRSDLFLRLEIIKKIMVVPVIMIGIYWGIHTMILGMIINSIIAYFLNSYFSGKYIKYSSIKQLRDILPSFLLAFFIGCIVYLIGIFLILPSYLILIIQLIVGGGFFFILGEVFQMKDYLYIKEIFLQKVLKIKNA